MEIKITNYINEEGEATQSFNVSTEERLAEGLAFDEALGLLAALLMPIERHCLFWLKTPEQIKAFNEKYPNKPKPEPNELKTMLKQFVNAVEGGTDNGDLTFTQRFGIAMLNEAKRILNKTE